MHSEERADVEFALYALKSLLAKTVLAVLFTDDARMEAKSRHEGVLVRVFLQFGIVEKSESVLLSEGPGETSRGQIILRHPISMGWFPHWHFFDQIGFK